MEPNEAIKRINDIKTEIDNWRDNLGEKLSDREILDIQAYDVAIEAIEKQIPKERIQSFGWKCPSCGREFVSNQTENYCSKCGQALKSGDRT